MRKVEKCDGKQCPIFLVDGKAECNALGCEKIGVSAYNMRNGLTTPRRLIDLDHFKEFPEDPTQGPNLSR